MTTLESIGGQIYIHSIFIQYRFNVLTNKRRWWIVEALVDTAAMPDKGQETPQTFEVKQQ